MNVLPDEIPIVDAALMTTGSLQRVNGGERYSEAHFDRLIGGHVKAIGSALRNAGIIGTACSLRLLAQKEQVANIDVLLAEVEGDELRRLVLVETKLFKNPEQHRTVLAQILDYANRLQFDVSVEEILAKADAPTREWLHDRRHHLDQVKARGDFLLVICGDRIQPRLIELARPMLDRREHVLSGLELALVSLALYEGAGTTVLVPNVVGAVVAGQRDLRIEVTVRTEGGTAVPAAVSVAARGDDDARATPARGAKRVWTKETFFEDVRTNADADWNPEPGLQNLVSFVEETKGIDFKWGAGQSATFSVAAIGSLAPTKIVWVDSGGGVSLHRSLFAEALGEKTATARVSQLARELGVTVKVDGHTPGLGASDSDYFDVNEAKEMRVFQRWIVQMRDEILAAQDKQTK
jgi:hypothetical protein